MNPSELKYHVEQAQDRFFFTRETMRFFGDRISNYGVRDGGTIPYHWDDTGNHYSETPRAIEIWELYRKHPVKHGLYTSAYFDKKTFKRVFKEKE
jgi:hypothetical protein